MSQAKRKTASGVRNKEARVIATRRSCRVRGTGLSHYALLEEKPRSSAKK